MEETDSGLPPSTELMNGVGFINSAVEATSEKNGHRLQQQQLDDDVDEFSLGPPPERLKSTEELVVQVSYARATYTDSPRPIQKTMLLATLSAGCMIIKTCNMQSLGYWVICQFCPPCIE